VLEIQTMLDVKAIQSALREDGADGWLLYDFRGLNILARRVLRFPADAHATRRWFYFIPAQGEPRKLVHRIEPGALDAYPGEKSIYLRWQELEAGVAELVKGCRRIAMEYVPRNANPYVSRVDAGTVELVRSCGVEVVPSGDLVQRFEACWDDAQWEMHLEAARHTSSAFTAAWKLIAERVRAGKELHEIEVQSAIMAHFEAHGLVTDHAPIVAVGPHSGDPHYAPRPGADGAIREGSFVLIDLWAKLARPRSVYSDLTWVGFVGRDVPARYEEVFQIVRRARDAAIERVRGAFAAGQLPQGYQVDDACREVIELAGYGAAFVHRTGHSIGEETHGNGANMDNLETHEARRVLPRTCFSVEPGIYLPEFGIRSEVNVYVGPDRAVHVTGPVPQTHVLRVLAEL
jgi:Xaa-Pro aminopeptidase